MRRALIAGNWKMNPPTRGEAVALASEVARLTDGSPAEVVVCPPFAWLEAVRSALAGSAVRLGGQDMHHEESGPFTGATSPRMLREVDAAFCIVGHSERRHVFRETDEEVGLKVASAVRHGIRPIAAVGEFLAERAAGRTAAVIERQLRAALRELDRLSGTGLVVAYEPIWAIGTGVAASPDDAGAAAAHIRSILADVDPATANEIEVLYGGSVTAANAAAFIAHPEIDGALVGGASLDAREFAGIVSSAAAQV